MARSKLSFSDVSKVFKALNLKLMQSTKGYSVNVKKKIHTFPTLQAATDFILAYEPGTKSSKIIVTEIACIPCVAYEMQAFQAILEAILEEIGDWIETTVADAPETARVYTTATEKYDIPEITVSSYWINLMSGSKRQWRVIESLDAERQIKACKDAKYSAVNEDEWQTVQMYQLPYVKELDKAISRTAAKIKAFKEKKKAEKISEAIGKNGKPKAVKENGEYKPGMTTKEVTPGSKIDKIIQMLGQGTTMEELSSAIGKDMTASYVAQRLALRGYGLKKEVGSDRYLLVKP
jgi:protein associated with RNAse G/E